MYKRQEFDYVGVIIGEDLRYENDELVTDYRRRAKTDSSVKGLKKLYREDPRKAKYIERQIILNTYYTPVSYTHLDVYKRQNLKSM